MGEVDRYVKYALARVLLQKLIDQHLMSIIEHYTFQFLIQKKKINLPILIHQHIKRNKYNMGGLIVKVLRKAEVDFRF